MNLKKSLAVAINSQTHRKPLHDDLRRVLIKRSRIAVGSIGFSLNGTDEYFTIDPFDPRSPYTVSYVTDNDDGFIVDPSSLPITEVGRVGASYHDGSISSLSMSEDCPLFGKSIPAVNLWFQSIDPATPIVVSGDFTYRIWFNCQSRAGGGTAVFFGGTHELFMENAQSANAGSAIDFRIREVAGSSSSEWVSPLLVDNSKYAQAVLSRVGADWTLTLHTTTGTYSNTWSGFGSEDITISILGNRESAGFPLNGQYGHIELEANGTNYAWNNTDETGNQVIDSGPNGNHGTWTGDGSDIDGATVDSYRSTITAADNRSYDFDTVGTIADLTGGTSNATLFGIDDSNWSGSGGNQTPAPVVDNPEFTPNATYPNLPLAGTASGYTTIVPHTNTQIIYVSSSEGNDSNDGLSEGAPKQTLSAGLGLMRDGFPDWLCLKAGDTWTDEGFGLSAGHSGQDADNPAVITSYGTGSRPIIERSGDGRMLTAQGNNISDNWAIVGLHFYNYDRNPDDPRYVSQSINGGEMVRWYRGSSSLLIEDCVSEWAGEAINFNDIDDNGLSGVKVYKNIILNSYSSLGGGDHSQGLYGDKMQGIDIQGNIFNHNGFYEREAGSVPNANATIFNHNVYLQNTVSNVVMRDNFLGQASSHGAQCREGGQITGNLVVRCPIGILVGVIDSGEVVGTICSDNTILQGTDIDSSNPRGWAIDFGNGSLAVAERNIVANSITSNTGRRGLQQRATATYAENIEVNWSVGSEDGSAYVDASRTPETYRDHIESTSGSTYEDFIQDLVAGTYRGSTSPYRVNVVNEWIRQGFVLA